MGHCGYFGLDTEYYEELEKLQEDYGEYCLQDCEYYEE